MIKMMLTSEPTEVNKPRTFPPSRGDSPSASTQNLLSNLEMDMMIPWWYHANTTAFGICWLLFIVVACFHSLTVSLPSAPCDLTKWFYLCCSTANQKAGLFRSLSQSLCQHAGFFSLAWASTFTGINVCSYYMELHTNCFRNFKHIRQAEPHAFNVPCEPMGSHPTRGIFRGGSAAAGHRKSMGFALGVWLECRRRIPILQDPQDDWSDSSGWLRPFILAGVTSEF